MNRHSKMVIYKITNKVNGKIYIGQTVNSFYRRYSGGKWWIQTNNDYLKKSANKYGRDNFTVEFLHENVESINKLNELEVYYINQFNSIYPNGYNFRYGGEQQLLSQEIKDKIALGHTKGKVNKLKNHKTGELVEFINVTKFCEERKLDFKLAVCYVLDGRRKYYLNWTLPETILESCVVISPDGKEYKVLQGEMARFCNEHKIINIGNFRKMCYGERHECYGWKINSNCGLFTKGIGWNGKPFPTRKKYKKRIK